MNKILVLRNSMYYLTRKYCTPPSGANSAQKMSPRYRPSNFEKVILVWTKKFKSKDEIPSFVSPDLIERSRSEARIKISNRLMVLTALASLGAILLGKAAAKRGETVHQMNLDWHKKYEEDYKQKHEASTKN